MSQSHPAEQSGIFGFETSRAVGDDARTVRKLLSQSRDRFFNSVSLGKARNDALDKLYSLFEQCCHPNWDGYSALPVTYETYVQAKQFIEALPTNAPFPDISADPDGDISFEWYHASKWVFSVSVGPNNELAYAGLFGAGKTHGAESFHGQISRTVLENIRRVAA